MAYSVKQKSAHDTVSIGSIRAELVNICDGKKRDEGGRFSVLPASECSNAVYVTNIGEYDAFVRINIELHCSSGAGDELPCDGIYPDISDTDWVYKDGYYYYRNVLCPGENTPPLYERICFDSSLGNHYKYSTVTETIYLEAVQSVNNGSSPLLAEGWLTQTELT